MIHGLAEGGLDHNVNGLLVARWTVSIHHGRCCRRDEAPDEIRIHAHTVEIGGRGHNGNGIAGIFNQRLAWGKRQRVPREFYRTCYRRADVESRFRRGLFHAFAKNNFHRRSCEGNTVAGGRIAAYGGCNGDSCKLPATALLQINIMRVRDTIGIADGICHVFPQGGCRCEHQGLVAILPAYAAVYRGIVTILEGNIASGRGGIHGFIEIQLNGACQRHTTHTGARRRGLQCGRNTQGGKLPAVGAGQRHTVGIGDCPTQGNGISCILDPVTGRRETDGFITGEVERSCHGLAISILDRKTTGRNRAPIHWLIEIHCYRSIQRHTRSVSPRIDRQYLRWHAQGGKAPAHW